MDRQFRCNICDKQFTRQQDFEFHMRRHQSISEKPCICDQCGKTFADQNSLQKHVQLHKITAVYCNLCGKPFANEEQLEGHKLTDHMDETEAHFMEPSGKEDGEMDDYYNSREKEYYNGSNCPV